MNLFRETIMTSLQWPDHARSPPACAQTHMHNYSRHLYHASCKHNFAGKSEHNVLRGVSTK